MSELMENVTSLAKRRGFVYPSSEIYGGLGSSYDYGHYGVLLRDAIMDAWKHSLLRLRDDVVMLDSAIMLHPETWQASGHLAKFSDPMIDCKTCKMRFRADQMEGSACGQKPSMSPGDASACDFTEPREYNLMFQTQMGAVDGQAVYLRPETAQGIFLNYRNALQTLRRKPPFGVAQIGKSFRNEITPGNFIFRMREFTQMEMEFFVPRADAKTWYEHWRAERVNWYLQTLGLRSEYLRVRDHETDELAHYAREVCDIEYKMPHGWAELEGIANRGDHDLLSHQTASRINLAPGEKELPYVIEPAAGLDRIMLAVLLDAYRSETVEGRERVYLSIKPSLAPVKVAVFPLVNRDNQDVIAREIYEDLRSTLACEYDSKGSIGKRYRRQDELGTPWCITVDSETVADNTVTIRDRDTLSQNRVPRDQVREWIQARL